ncbi:spliceosome-associated protein CWC27 homolog [Malaya genurostris]|uniref:spliceosome-associated protein CWC27 homolog n=1 Tax=Malaya genurostris TaxID=325434 RepID=UPI0026F3DDF1|nr:spliceosome-associated protein CWC27 homolog [Malaya genurostris]
MSNIYIQEPPTTGKVLLKTTVGDIDIELWSRESPLACRNFVQLCMEGYYNGTIFHRVVRGFIVQGGDPNGDGTGGESIYGHPFKDEFHSRLRFVRRGLVAMANSGKNDNGSQFFFTLGATPELQNMHTLFAKVGGDTIYNMLKLEDGEIYENERPHFPHKILKTEILHNPFPDIIPRLIKQNKNSEEKVKKKKEKGVKNYGLLSFGDEAEEEEQESIQYVQKNIAVKGKSSHDVLDDPRLSKQVIDIKGAAKNEAKRRHSNSSSDSNSENEAECADSRKKELIEQEANNIREKLKRRKETEPAKEMSSDSDSDFGLGSERQKIKQEQAAKIREEITKLKKEYQSDKRKDKAIEQQNNTEKKKNESNNEVMKEFLAVQEQYSEKKKLLPKKGISRENFTLQLLEKFKNKLQNVQEQSDEPTASGSRTELDEEEDIQGDSWLSHRLQFETNDPILAKDAVTKDDDWYDVYDPRNPLNKRKRGEKVEMKEKPRK